MKLLTIALTAIAVATSANAANLVTNGGFETTTGGSTGQLNCGPGSTPICSGAPQFEATGWSTVDAKHNYDFVFSSATATTTGANGYDGNVKLWSASPSPNGGNFLGSDPDYSPAGPDSTTGGSAGAISQTINGLTAGDKYVVTFDQAGAEQNPFSGPTTEYWQVSLGAEALDSAILSNASKGFTGWSADSLTFTAASGSEVLSFLAEGTGGSGLPPFALLDGVSMTQVPEPATWAMMLVGFGALGTAVRSRRKRALATA